MVEKNRKTDGVWRFKHLVDGTAFLSIDLINQNGLPLGESAPILVKEKHNDRMVAVDAHGVIRESVTDNTKVVPLGSCLIQDQI